MTEHLNHAEPDSLLVKTNGTHIRIFEEKTAQRSDSSGLLSFYDKLVSHAVFEDDLRDMAFQHIDAVNDSADERL